MGSLQGQSQGLLILLARAIIFVPAFAMFSMLLMLIGKETNSLHDFTRACFICLCIYFVGCPIFALCFWDCTGFEEFLIQHWVKFKAKKRLKQRRLMESQRRSME